MAIVMRQSLSEYIRQAMRMRSRELARVDKSAREMLKSLEAERKQRVRQYAQGNLGQKVAGKGVEKGAVRES
jgi:hypothetical protein